VNDPILYLVAVTIDHYYTAFEAVIERITRAFEGLPDHSDRWHKDLLEGACLELSDVRSAIIGRATYSPLLKLLEFRHFMRHAYAVELDPGQLLALSRELLSVHRMIASDLDVFTHALRGGSTAP